MLAWLAAAAARDVYAIVNAPTFDEEPGARKVRWAPQSSDACKGAEFAEWLYSWAGNGAGASARWSAHGRVAGPRAGIIALRLPYMLRLRLHWSTLLFRGCDVAAL